MIFALSAKVMFIQNQGVCFLGAGPQEVHFEDFKGIFCSLPCGTSRMLICPILSPYLSGPWSWTECSNDHVLVVCVTTSMAEFDFLVSFLQGLWLAKMAICSILEDHVQIISVTVKRLVTSHIISSKYSY